MSRFNYLIIFFLGILLSSCTNQFAYKPNAWKEVTQTEPEKEDYTTAYIDENKTSCKEEKCQAWTKLIFKEERPIAFGGSKRGEVSGEMNVKRIDSSVEYDCKRHMVMIISYQLYDGKDQMIDSKWIKFEPEYVEPGTVHYDLMKASCKDLLSK